MSLLLSGSDICKCCLQYDIQCYLFQGWCGPVEPFWWSILGILCRLMSDMSRLEAKMERLSDQLNSKERELQTMANKVTKRAPSLILLAFYIRWICNPLLLLVTFIWSIYYSWWQEQKASTAFKSQLEKLQQEKDEYQRMVITTQVWPTQGIVLLL